MTIELSSIVKESLAAKSNEFIRISEDAINLLRNEIGRTGNLKFLDRLVELEPLGIALVVGDLHGDLRSLITIIEASDFIHKIEKDKDLTIVFLGDYGDRGAYSAEVYYVILRIKLAYPEHVILLLGNHEGPEDLMASPHDLPRQFQARFRREGTTAYIKIRELFTHLHNAVYVQERYLMVHGGLSPKITSLQDLAEAQIMHPKEKILEDLLWSDPSDFVRNVAPSPRGAGKLFGKEVTRNVMEKLNAKILIRSHESAREGFKINHCGKVLTLFSRKGVPYFNEQGAYLELPLSEEFTNAEQLIPWIRKF